MSNTNNNNNALNSGTNSPPNYSLILDNSVPEWSNSLITKELKQAISDIIPIKDTDFDRHDFDPVQYINEHFSNEQSLHKLDHVMNKLKFKINLLDEEIIQSIRLQSNVGQKGKEDLENSKRSIQELVSKIKDIKNKAIQSESMVTEICKDIKTLDFAKKNLTSAITTLKRLQMMVLGLDQLKDMVEKKSYSRVAGLLEATDQISEAFKNYKNNPKIANLSKNLDLIKSKVKQQIYEEFKNYQSLKRDEDSDSPQVGKYPSEHWKSSCYIISALGEETKKDFLMWFCDTQMGSYDASNYELYSLENTKIRFGWLAKRLGKFENEYEGVFPAEWNIQEELAYKFCVTTKFSLSNLLKVKKDKNEIEVAVLLKVLKQTLEFESHLFEKFESDSRLSSSPSDSPDYSTPDNISIQNQHNSDNSDDSDSDSEQGPRQQNYNSEEEIRKRWLVREEKDKKKELERNSSSNSLASNNGASSDKPSGSNEKPPKRSHERIKGVISSCFDQYMELYIEQENILLNDSISMFLSKETWKIEDESAPNKVLQSSADLVFLFVKIMNRCSSFSKNEPYYLLFQLFKKYLNAYAVALSNKIQIDVNRIHDQAEDKTLSLIINTCEYCQKTTQQMEDTFKGTIDNKFKELIDLKEIMNEFSSIIAKSTKSLVSGLEAKLDSSLLTITKLDWESDHYVGDTLPSTIEMINHINDTFRLQSKFLSHHHYRYLCDLFAASFSLRLLQTIYKCTRISETGAQYILLDISTIKQTLLSLPNENAKDTRNNSRYVRLVNKEFGKIENLLKVVGCQKDALIDTYNKLFPEPSDSEFKKIMDLKGMRTSDKTELLDKYISKVDQTLTSIKKFLPIPTSLFN